MQAKDVDDSAITIRIVMSLLTGEKKLAKDIARDYHNPSMTKKYRNQCKILSLKKLLLKYPHPHQSGYFYSLNYDIFIQHLIPGLHDAPRDDIVAALQYFKPPKSTRYPRFMKGDYAKALIAINVALSIYVHHKSMFKEYDHWASITNKIRGK